MRRAPAILCAAAASALAIGLYSRVAWPWFALGWVGLVPWLAALDRLATLRGALAAGLAMSVLFTLAVFPWFVGAVAGYADAPWTVGLVAVVLMAPLIQPQFIVQAAARQVARRRGAAPWHVALLSACAYVGAEWLLPKLFADTLGHGFLADAHLRQAADLGGAHGLTLLLLLANEALLQAGRAARRGAWRRATATALALLLSATALAGYGAVRLRQFAAAEAVSVTPGVVQAGLGHYDQLATEIGMYAVVRRIVDAHVALSQELLSGARPDFLVWPETVYPTTFGAPKSPDGAAFDAEIAAFVARAGVPLLLGAYAVGEGREYNAAFVLQPGAAPADAPAYRKARLFPFTERVPAWLDTPALRARLPWLGTWVPGAGARTLPLHLADGRVLRIAPLICYDAVDPSLAIAAAREGAELIVTLSNDSWFAAGNGPWLHLVVAAFRSIETRRPQVRATNTGLSAIVSASGEIRQTIGVGVAATLAAPLAPRAHPWTLMLAWGDWLPPTAALAALALAAPLWWRREEISGSPHPVPLPAGEGT